MLDIVQAIGFGAVQGVTEFLPISSSGHLVILHALLNPRLSQALSFDVALHVGTFLALAVYFRRDIRRYAAAWFHSFRRWQWRDPDQRLAWYLVIGSIPGGLAGLALDQAAETTFRSPVLVAMLLLVAGIVLWLVDRFSRIERSIDGLRWWEVLAIGLGQAFALVPGVSRSGATITVGRWLGLDRPSAARFSFLLAIPITAAAGFKKLFDLRHAALSGAEQAEFLVGALTAAAVGVIAIRFLLRFVSRRSYAPFAVYRLIAAAAALTYFLRP